VNGISLNPISSFNPTQVAPTIGGVTEADVAFRNRIIGNVTLGNTLAQLELVMGVKDSIRADEGTPFAFGTIRSMADRVTVHALVGSGVVAGNNNTFGTNVLIHGGADTGNNNAVQITLGSNITVGDDSVIFRSNIGDGVVIGKKVYIDNSQIAASSIIADKSIIINNQFLGFVEW